ncbi:hypothetical protein PPERSA_06511 [Pseudocohnilembus persalinus]|uniref:DUF4200 domain-containing protein n=1 Tax=Pseudocohnilembus persalinus TaxID=266149 RepID=A0A0V0QRT5_PSEPJ|nr:hypothetical protein PPERSA_06511 [Pseudocohnilembus persalinus]|eukprot:KRX04877.1 hypothetical protein PPERSA_06511 [Pseudocohnilembus persalinus]
MSTIQLPTDEEVFQYVQMEKQKKDDDKRGIVENKIWDKRTATSKNALKHFKSFQGQINDKHQPLTSYKSDDKRMIQVALDICKKRKQKTDNSQKKEPVVEMLDQKKEMFLVTMSHGIIQSEIQRLQNISKEREMALQLSKKLLKQDEQQFTQYVEKNKKEKLMAEQEAENQGIQRKNKEQLLKELNIKLISIRAEKTRNEELVASYLENKQFLDKLAPQEWRDKKERKKQEYLKQRFEDWLYKQEEKQLQSEEAEYRHKNKKNKVDKQSIVGTQQWRNQKLQEYYERAKNDDLDILTDFEAEYDDNFFQQPQQLVEYFDLMEQKNLNQLSENQEIEELYENTYSAFKKIEGDTNRRINSLKEQKEQFRKQIEDLDNQIRGMKRKSEENKNMINKEGQELCNQIIQVYQLFQSELPQISDFKNTSVISILAEIEQHIDYQLNGLKGQNIKIVGEQRKIAEKKRKFKIRQELNAKQELEMDIQKKKNLEKLNSQVKKREGRMPMQRSMPLVKEQKIEETQINDSDEDNKYFQDAYDLSR